jgi:uncharacterized integral membrane protein
MVDAPVAPSGQPGPARRRRGHPARAVGVLAVVAVIVVFVVQNSQRVTVRLWFVTGHVRLIWLIAGCLVVAGVLGFLLGRGGRRRTRRRSKER